ncbi:MAG: hypothetical protein RIQ93_50 [Verrucomicrobiota bacterium]|jgi:hypothetical protein
MNTVLKRLLVPALVALSVVFIPRSRAAAEEVDAIEAAARAFMAGYAEDLLALDREAVIARYHSDGALMITASRNRFVPLPQIAEQYRRPGWKGLGAFAWQGLQFRAVSPDTVFVEGAFTSGPATQPKTTTYFAILVKEAGQLKLRSEVEFPKR